MEWIAYCYTCGELDRAPNGPMMESTARLHRRDTGHTTIVGYEPSIVMSGEMVEVKVGEQPKGEIPLNWYTRLFSEAIGGQPFFRVRNYYPVGWPDDPRIEDSESSIAKYTYDDWQKRASPWTFEQWQVDVLRVAGRPLSAAPERLFPQTYGDWVNIAEDIKAKYPDDPAMRASVNFQLGRVAQETEEPAELKEERLQEAKEAKRWLAEKAGELGIK